MFNMSFNDIIGFISGLCFMLSAIPLVYRIVKVKKTDTPLATILLVSTGSVLMMIYGFLCYLSKIF